MLEPFSLLIEHKRFKRSDANIIQKRGASQQLNPHSALSIHMEALKCSKSQSEDIRAVETFHNS